MTEGFKARMHSSQSICLPKDQCASAGEVVVMPPSILPSTGIYEDKSVMGVVMSSASLVVMGIVVLEGEHEATPRVGSVPRISYCYSLWQDEITKGIGCLMLVN